MEVEVVYYSFEGTGIDLGVVLVKADPVFVKIISIVDLFGFVIERK
jgi:hypothetical protein